MFENNNKKNFIIEKDPRATNVTQLDPNPDLGTGYYPPPYTYDQCLGVFNKKSIRL